MNIKIGLIIKMLRIKKRITQEQLATYLGVTPQAISRWEAENGYPDLETLPSLADFFSITVDELIGYNQFEREKKIQEAEKEIKRLKEVGSDLECVNYARQAVALFPGETRLQLDLANFLSREIWNENADRNALTEAKNIYQTVIETSVDDEIKFDAISNLCTLYAKGFKDNKKAKETANRLPKMIYCREFTKSSSLCDDDVIVYIQDEIDKLTDCLGTAIQNLVLNDNLPNDPSTWDKKIWMMEISTKIYQMIYGENMMFYHNRLAFNHWIISTYQILQDKNDDALLSIQNMCHHAIAYDESYKNEHGKYYTSAFVDHLVYKQSSKDFHEIDEHSLCWYMLDRLSHERYSSIRDDAMFQTVIDKLKIFAR